MSEAEASVITESIEEAKKLIEADNSVLALEMICQDWMEAKGKAPERTNLEDHIAYLQEAYGCVITWRPATEEDDAVSEREEENVEVDENDDDLSTPPAVDSGDQDDDDVLAALGIE
jgi:hypothetical protein